MTNLALNPFKKGKKTDVEGVRKVEVENDSLLQKVLEQYNSIEEGESYDSTRNYISSLEKIILPPAKINLFLQEVILKGLIKGSKPDLSNITGFYISKLIQDSYDQGNNNFVLDIQDYSIICLPYKLNGKADPINVTINGNTGISCGSHLINSYLTINGNTKTYLGFNSESTVFTIQGNVGDDCGERSTNSIFTINGTTGNYCGRYAKNSHFTINGNTGNFCGERSTNSIFTINGTTGNYCGWDSTNSTYKTSNQKTYEKMLEDVPESNTIQLLGPNREVLKEVKK